MGTMLNLITTVLTEQNFKLTLWNANGLTQHVEELKMFISQHNMYVMLISQKENPAIAPRKLQTNLLAIQSWLTKLRMKAMDLSQHTSHSPCEEQHVPWFT
jgi:translation elongation factor EF-1alpha